MKKILFSVAALAAAMTFTACSSEDELVQAGPQWSNDGNGYMAFTLSMPEASAPASRGVNDKFHNGLAEEFKVNDIALLLFCGPDEDNATFRSAYKLADNQFGGVENLQDNNITADNKYVQEIKAVTQEPGDNIYALVVINKNGVFNVTDRGSLTIGGQPVAIGAKFADLQKRIVATNVNATEFTDGGFFMLNAPLYDTKGNADDPSAGHIRILANCNTAIYASKADAEAAEGAHVYVERAVSKVTMQPNNGSNANFSWALNGWQLDNTNSQSYILRHMKEEGKFDFMADIDGLKSHAFPTGGYRMVGDESTAHRGNGNAGSTGVTNGTADSQNQYRTYFAYDPNYDKEGTFHDVVKAHNDAENLKPVDERHPYQVKTLFGDANPQYCAENTFNVDHQNWGQTTRVLIAATLTPGVGEVLYAHAGDDHFMNITDLKHDVWTKTLAKLSGSDYVKLFDGVAQFEDSKVVVDNAADGIKVDLTSDLHVKTALVGNDAAVEALHVLKYGTTNEYYTTVAQVEADMNKILKFDLKASDYGYSYYAGGMSYYDARIKHFGDELTPWNNGEFGATVPSHGSVATIYPSDVDRDGNYLGRWGMLRNNWYDLNVSIIKKIGHATPEELELTSTKAPTPDDDIDEEKWINIEVNILSWAKRTQDIEL